MIVYRVSASLEFQGITSDEYDRVFDLTKNGAEVIGDCVFPECYVSSLKEKRGNFFRITSGSLLCDDLAKNALSEVLPNKCEFITVKVEDIGTLTFINVPIKLNPIDEDRSIWKADKKRKTILKYEFDTAELVDAPCLFRVPQHRYNKLMTVTGRPAYNDDFYTRYHDAGLTGLEFSKLWSYEN